VKKRLAATCIAAICGSAPAHAATVRADPTDNQRHIIHVQGTLVKGDGQQFADVVRKADVKPGKATVYLDSAGGLVVDGLAIARIIRKNEWDTYVEPGKTCSSMCANIWLAGRTRYATPTSHIGFHSLSNVNRPGQRDEEANGKFMAYYREIGISMKAARVFMAAEPGNDAIWLDRSLTKALGIDVTVMTFNERMKTASAATQPTVATSPAPPVDFSGLKHAYSLPLAKPEPQDKPPIPAGLTTYCAGHPEAETCRKYAAPQPKEYWLPRNVAWPLQDDPPQKDDSRMKQEEVKIDPRLLTNVPLVPHGVQTVAVPPVKEVRPDVKLPTPKPTDVKREVPMDADVERTARPADAKQSPSSGDMPIKIACMKQYGAYVDPQTHRLTIHGGLTDLQPKIDAIHFCFAQKTGRRVTPFISQTWKYRP
jgi:hypothetical protein